MEMVQLMRRRIAEIGGATTATSAEPTAAESIQLLSAYELVATDLASCCRGRQVESPSALTRLAATATDAATEARKSAEFKTASCQHGDAQILNLSQIAEEQEKRRISACKATRLAEIALANRRQDLSRLQDRFAATTEQLRILELSVIARQHELAEVVEKLSNLRSQALLHGNSHKAEKMLASRKRGRPRRPSLVVPSLIADADYDPRTAMSLNEADCTDDDPRAVTARGMIREQLNPDYIAQRVRLPIETIKRLAAEIRAARLVEAGD